MALGGITYFDTAYYHDQTEKFLGKALTARHPRDTYTIATKLPLSVIQTAEDLEKTLNLQLARLNTSISISICAMGWCQMRILKVQTHGDHRVPGPYGRGRQRSGITVFRRMTNRRA